MDDCALWGETSRQLRAHLADMTAFLRGELSLELKPEPYINRTSHGMDFLGCRVFPRHITLNRRSRVRFRRKLRGLEHTYGKGELDEDILQQRATAMVAFTRVPGVSSWRCRQGVLDFLPVSGPGRAAGDPWRELEQQPAQLPVGEPQQEHAGEPEQQRGVPPGPSSARTADAVLD
jgi:hypothetical protein